MLSKPRLDLERAARPEDSTQRSRSYAAIINGTPIQTDITFPELLEKCGFDENDRQEDGSYVFQKGTVDARLTRDEDVFNLCVVTTRPDKPVRFSMQLVPAENGLLRLKTAFANHANPELDHQRVNNPEMLDFALSKVHEEIKLVKDPVWWVSILRDYDTAFAQAYINKHLGGIDPTSSSFEQPKL